ncbi:MAG TPA: LysR family transcriptional regulator [Gammaproteobacteria bacterium]|nr:LysR family transcriptional regulator [Gammaproteobacteria bacterium]
MLIRHLTYFVALAREQHFARAAAACNVTQPTLTAAIKKLEEHLGVPLVIRDHRFVRLTDEGEKVLLWGRQILADYGSLKDDLAGVSRGLTGTLRLGVIPAAMSVVSLLTSRFMAAHPAAHVDIRSMTSRAIERGLGAFELDAGVTYLENEPLDNVRKVPLYRERYVLAARRGHPATVNTTITWKEAAAQRLCLLSEDMQNRRIINNVAASIGVQIEPHLVSDSFLAILGHLRHGEWASVVPHTFVGAFIAGGDLVAVDIIEPVHTQLEGLVFSDRAPLSPLSAALLSSIADVDFESAVGATLQR